MSDDKCPWCGAAFLHHPRGSTTTIWKCASWENVSKGLREQSLTCKLGLSERFRCRIAELEAEVERLSRQYSELAHAAWYAPLDEALTATHAETLAEMEADRVRLQEAILEIERLRKAAGGTNG